MPDTRALTAFRATPLVLALLCTPLLRAGAADPHTLRLTVRDAAGEAKTLVIGIGGDATAGFDAALGEAPVPPPPPLPLFDARLLDPEGRKQYPFEASWVDIRPWRSAGQRDTFHVACQTGRMPVTVTWDVPEGFAERLTLVEVGKGVRTDMLRSGSALAGEAGGDSACRFLVIVERPRR